MSKAVAKRWDYDDSVAKVKPLVMKWGTLTLDMLGELCAARAALSREGHPRTTGQDCPVRTWASYCEDIGLPKRTANHWLKQYDPERRKLLEAPKAHVEHNSGNNEWYTPPEIVESARSAMGGIDLDPASSTEAQETVKAEAFYSIEDDGLSKEWAGKVFLNPPYASGLVERFVVKLLEEWKADRTKEAVVLTNNATETKWWQELSGYASAVCFPKGRLRYRTPENEKTATGLQGQCLLYLGDNATGFLKAFRERGECWPHE